MDKSLKNNKVRIQYKWYISTSIPPFYKAYCIPILKNFMIKIRFYINHTFTLSMRLNWALVVGDN